MAQEAASAHDRMDIAPEDDWSHIEDKYERKKIQNRLAQRKYRDKLKQSKEQAERDEANQHAAGGSYTPLDPNDLSVPDADESGLPWGSLSWRHIVEAGRAREQTSAETSPFLSGGAASRTTGGSSRLGLHLANHYARGPPAWSHWRHRIVGPQAELTALHAPASGIDKASPATVMTSSTLDTCIDSPMTGAPL